MGGYGSGRSSSRHTVEESYEIDTSYELVRRLLMGSLPSGYGFRYAWTERRSGEERACIHLFPEAASDTDRAEAVAAKYRSRPPGGEWENHEQRIRVEWTPCNFGGERPWWRCPQCRSPCRVVYLTRSSSQIACRDCHDLTYQSTRDRGNSCREWERRFSKIYEKLTGEHGHPWRSTLYPLRPKGMHQDTYEELLEDLHEAQDRWHDALVERFGSLMGA